MLRAGDLRQKEVINIATGMRVGFVSDVEINFEDGYIESIVVPGPSRFFFFFAKSDDYIIPWKDIIRVGDDIILVDMPQLVNKTAR
ncbi:MAG: YlmC/YmxH family sporulation protein [Ruminococcaceae bacterium]|nr:YlmC/YmxH family sporulation protein [Oscillospiraceae bacterium]